MSGQIVGAQPANWLDYVLWPLLRLSWEKISRKQSHWWHWLSYDGPISKTILVAGDSRLSTHTFWHSNVFWGTNFTWQQVVVLHPVRPVVFQVGFIGSGVRQLCSIQVSGDVALTRGPQDNVLFGVTTDGQPLELQVVDYSTRRRLSRKIPIL